MKRFWKFSLPVFAALLLLGGLAFGQSKENGAIEGKVMTPDGEGLPGVAVTAASPNLIGGKQVAITNENGRFRFVALPPGEYALEAALEGFNTARRTGIKLSVGMTLTVDFPLQMGKIEEKIVVKGMPPMVDVKDSQTASTTITNDLIANIPNNQFVTNIVNLAPGVSKDSAFGASDNGVQYQIDGVDVSDPELHTAYVFMDYGVVDEAKVMGVGAPAEYDGFSGIVLNTVTKTGGNKLSGMFDSFIQPISWNGKNSTDPNLTSPVSALYNVHFSLGGPFIKDKLWFFMGLEYYRSDRQPSGFPAHVVYDQPRSFWKLTWQPDTADRLSAFIEADIYNGTNRGADAYTDPAATRKQRSPEIAFNLSYLHIFSDHTFLESKFAGFVSYYKLIPTSGYDLPGHYDYGTQRYSVNATAYYHAYRNRYQLNTALSHHAEDFIKGSHDFKFGVEVELNPTKTQYGYSGGWRYLDYYGEPYLARQYQGYETKATNFRTSAYLQDSWSFSDRLKINPGVRFNYYRGKLDARGTVFKPEIAIAPRIGLTFDLFGDHKTALKAHWGQFYDNIVTQYYARMNPVSDFVKYYYDAGEWVEYSRQVWSPDTYKMDSKIKMPYMNQFTVGIERELFEDVSLGVNYIRRDNKQFIDQVNTGGQFVPETFTDPQTGRQYTVYNELNPGEDKWVITNPVKGQYPIVNFTPTRKYSGIEVVLNKRFSHGWQLLASYVHGKATGTSDNYYADVRSTALGQSYMFTDPNYQVNANGPLGYDPTHMVKLQGTVILPFDVYFSGYFSYITGDPYSRELKVTGLNQDVMYIFADPRGSVYAATGKKLRLPAQTNLDLRLEKSIRFGNTRVGLMVDCFNVFNASTVTSVLTANDELFQSVVSIVNPRLFRAGLRVQF